MKKIISENHSLMENQMIRTISVYFPYSFWELLFIYDIVKSYDGVISICELAGKIGCSPSAILSETFYKQEEYEANE